MAPGGGGKRKRPERIYSHESRDEGSRPSPHRPDNLSLGQQSNQHPGQQSQPFGKDQYDPRGGGRRRAGRGGRGGGSQRSPMNSPNAIPLSSRPNTSSSNPKSPTLQPSQPSTDSKPEPAPLPPARNTATTQTPEPEPAKFAPYYFEHVTDNRIAAWANAGRKEVVEAAIQARNAEDVLVLGCIYQELLRSALDGRLNATEAGTMVKEILEADGNVSTSPSAMEDDFPFDASSYFLDVLSIYTEATITTPSLTPSLRMLVFATDIPPQKMRRELDAPLLEALGMIRSTFVRVGIRQQTNLLYRQSNYNLLREETEGYSKLLTELFTTSSNEPPTSEIVEETFERVKGMIGAFDLDVGRVLDITLDVFAAVLVKQYRFFVKYLRASSWWPQDKLTASTSAEHSLSTLPKWALPGSSGRQLSEEEKDMVVAARIERDEAFWARAKEVGMAAFFEIGGRRTEESALNRAIKKNSADLTQDDEDRKWVEITRTLPPPGNRVAAQVLGFKLRFYSSTARDPIDVLPVNLIYLSALLIKVGFISLRDLYPHIWPADPAMEEVKEEKMKEKVEREKLNRPGGGAMNALMAAAALPDDTLDGKAREAARLREIDAARRNPTKVDLMTERSTPAAQPEEKIEELPEPSEQKVQLLKSLLCIGALPEALYMLGRFPWLPDAFPELPEHIHRILHHSLSKVYEDLRPLKDQASLREQQKYPDPDQSSAAKGGVKLMDAPPRKTMRWAQLDKEDTNESIDYKFYWDDWADNVPVCQTIDDVLVLCSTLLNLSGVKVGQDPVLLLKIARIGHHSLATDTSDSNLARWTDLSKRLLVPALSFTKQNPGVVNEIWELIKNFPTATRYNMYAEWYLGQISRQPDIKSAFDQARAETKDVLKRISKTTIKPMARALAKVAYASPGIVFSVAINQLESYENIADAVVECARYFTELAYDVLTWSLMSALGGAGRNRVQADGMLTSKWLAALSLFAGKVFRRYTMMEPTPIIHYVADQLRQGNSTDLIILEEITKSMAGIISDSNFNEAQVQAMAGGESLQAQALLQLMDRRHESKSSGKRLMKSLTSSKLAGQILVSLAQERRMCIFRIEEANAHPKLLGNLFDQLHRILVQFLELLRSNLSVKEFDLFVPGVAQLINEFGIEPSVAFWIGRLSIAEAIAEYDAKNGKQNPDSRQIPTNETGDAALEIQADSGPERSGPNGIKADDDQESATEAKAIVEETKRSTKEVVNGLANAENGVLELKDIHGNSSAVVSPPPVKVENIHQPWHPVLQEVMHAIRPALPEETWEILSQPFYVTFWQLSLPDMHLPIPTYEDEISRQKKKIVAINNDRSDISIAGTRQKDKEKKAITDLQDRLRIESRDRLHAYTQVRARIQKEKEFWFPNAWGKWDALNVALIEHCFFPRILMSPVDAFYTFKWLLFLHGSGTPNFRTMGLLDQLFKEKRLTSLVFLCSAKEAESLGRFLNEVLRELSKWHADKTVFEKMAYGAKKDLPGFCRKMSTDKDKLTFLEFEDFRRILLKWHRGLNGALKNCIGSGEYMHVRNAINILNHVHQHFPAVNYMGQSLITSVTELSKAESREDLKVAATSLIGGLKRREKEWVIPQAFSLATTDTGTTNTNGLRSTSAKPSTPRPEGENSKSLNPKAPEFQPSPRLTVNGAPKPAGTASERVEAEDGEIEDAKMTDAPPTENATIKALPAEFSKDSTEAARAGSRRESPAPAQSQPSRHPESATSKAETRPTVTPASHQPSTSSRPDMPRNSSSTSVNGRVQHNLPTKPDVPPPRVGDHRMAPRSSERGPPDYARDARFHERGGTRDLLRDRDPNRSTPGPHPHGHERPGDRTQPGDRDHMGLRYGSEKPSPGRAGIDDRYGGPSTRDARPPHRDDRSERPPSERPYSEQHQSRRDAEPLGQHARDSAMLPPRSNIPQHPDRAALIHGGQGSDRAYPNDRRPEPSRQENYPHSERSSRGPSPTRADDRRPPRYDGRRDERPPNDGRRPIEDPIRPNAARVEESHAPTGPRTSRPANAAPLTSNDRFRESMKPSPVAPPPDPNHGRLSHDSNFNNRQGESQYGRLNTDGDIPSGPRLPNGNHPSGRGGRNVSAPQPQLNTQVPAPSHHQATATPTQDRPTPSGPAMRGSPRKPGPFPLAAAPSSAPSTPVTETAGIHPDRLKAIQGSGAGAIDSASQNRADSGRSSRPPPPSISTPASGPPRGPGNQLPSPVGPLNVNRGPPTGPAMPNDRSGRDKRFAGLQNVLQQGAIPSAPERSGQGASIRGRGGRANNANVASPSTSGPPTPGPPRQDQLHPQDLFAERQNGQAVTHQSDEDAAYGRGRRGGPRELPREAERRSGRHRSRSPGKERVPGAPVRARDEELLPRDGARERPRGNEVPSERDLRVGGPPEASIRGSDSRDRVTPRDVRRSGREEQQYRERDQREGPERREDRDRRDGGGSGRKRGRGGEDGPGERNFSDSKRPRR